MGTSDKLLLGDLSNGSYFKLAFAERGKRPESVGLYCYSNFAAFEDAILSSVADNGNPQLLGAAFSTLGWDVDGHIDLVHYGFSLNRDQVCDLLGMRRVSMVSDFVAKALAIPVLEETERNFVCGSAVRPDRLLPLFRLRSRNG